MERRNRWQWRRLQSDSWRVGETFFTVRGKWMYLYRAVEKLESTIVSDLSSTRNAKAAKRFLGKALKALKIGETYENQHR
jgi:transposase-like protein